MVYCCGVGIFWSETSSAYQSNTTLVTMVTAMVVMTTDKIAETLIAVVSL